MESALERKLRLQKLQEEADLDNASHLFGNEFMVKTGEEGKATAVVAAAVAAKQVDWLDALNPSTQLDFNNMSDHLCKRLRAFEVHKNMSPPPF